MPIQYENYQGKAYYLHCGQTKTGKPKYYFSMKSSGETLADAIPAGYEVYEKPNGQVFLRKSTPQLISEAEIEIVD